MQLDHPYTIDDARGFIAFASGADPERAFAVTVDDLPVGSIGAVLGEDVERCWAEVGYWLGESLLGPRHRDTCAGGLYPVCLRRL